MVYCQIALLLLLMLGGVTVLFFCAVVVKECFEDRKMIESFLRNSGRDGGNSISKEEKDMIDEELVPKDVKSVTRF